MILVFINFFATVSIQKNIAIIEKYKAILNLNVKIQIQKPKLFFYNKYLINFFLASIPFTYKRIIDNLNMRDTLILNNVICLFQTKKTKFTNLEVIKEENVYFAIKIGFHKG